MMDERILRWNTVLLGCLMVLACVLLPYMPEVRARQVMAEEDELEQQSDGEDITAIVTAKPEDVVEEAEDLGAQLTIELPPELDEKQLQITNEYVTQTVYIRFADGISDYFSKYSIRGSSNHIASLAYYLEAGDGVIALTLDRVYELSEKYRDGKLYLDFTDPHEIYDKVVVVDAGHGSRAAGAVKNKIMEKHIDLAIVQELKDIFDKKDETSGVDDISVNEGLGENAQTVMIDGRKIRIYYTRLADTNPTLDQRVQLANRSQADLFLSIHNNASNSGNFSALNGTQVLYSESDDSEYSSKQLAQICLDHVTESFESRKIGLMKGDMIYIIRTSEVPVALIEVGFMTNYTELDKLNDPKYQKKAAKGVYHAIMEAFETGY